MFGYVNCIVLVLCKLFELVELVLFEFARFRVCYVIGCCGSCEGKGIWDFSGKGFA